MGRLALESRFQLGDGGVTAMVASLVDQLGSLGEAVARRIPVALVQMQPSIFQMGVGLMQPHTAATGNSHRLVEIAPRPVESAVNAVQRRAR